MTLELTPTEYDNLVCRLSDSSRRRQSNPMRTSRERESEILKMVNGGTPNMEIRRVLRTSDYAINKIKRANGLWGA